MKFLFSMEIVLWSLVEVVDWSICNVWCSGVIEIVYVLIGDLFIVDLEVVGIKVEDFIRLFLMVFEFGEKIWVFDKSFWVFMWRMCSWSICVWSWVFNYERKKKMVDLCEYMSKCVILDDVIIVNLVLNVLELCIFEVMFNWNESG